MKDISPLVTVYIPTHNRVALLNRAVQSIISQTYKNLEIIVVNDGSTDNTDQFMQDFIKKHPLVKYLKHQSSQGANVARNYAIKESKGYFITGLDDDDEMLPNRIEKLVKGYDEKYAYVFSRWNIIENNKKTHTQNYKFNIISLNDMLYKNLTGNQVLTTRKMFINAGLFDETLPASQDYDMWIRMLQIKPRAKMINEPTYNHYVTSQNRITTSKHRKKGYIQCYQKHKNLMSLEQRQHTLLYLRHIGGKKNTSFKIIHTLNSIYKWPRLYLGFMLRSLKHKSAKK